MVKYELFDGGLLAHEDAIELARGYSLGDTTNVTHIVDKDTRHYLCGYFCGWHGMLHPSTATEAYLQGWYDGKGDKDAST